MVKGLVGAPIGGRVLMVLPPAEAFGEAGQSEMGVGPNDSLVFVFDVLDAFVGDETAEGTAVEPPPGGPTIAEGDTGPAVTIPATAPPTELVVQPLIEGAGPAVETGQVIVVQYRGVLWKDGSEFDATWGKNQPAGFMIGTGNVIPGWDKALVGQPVGSRVLVTVPPAEGYGAEGNPPAIAGDDTLVFVVDILGAYGEPAEPAGEGPTETPAG
jgi:peptidylprolyl isomerase